MLNVIAVIDSCSLFYDILHSKRKYVQSPPENASVHVFVAPVFMNICDSRRAKL